MTTNVLRQFFVLNKTHLN